MPVKTTAIKPIRTEDVFYESKKHPESHFPRESIKTEITDSKKAGKTILIYGGAYTGKTFLIHNNFDEEEYIQIDCVASMTPEQFYSQILKSVGYLVMTGTSQTAKNGASMAANISVSLPGLNLGMGSTNAGENESSITYAPLQLCLTDPSDIIRALEKIGFDQYIVLGMFDKLKPNVRKKIISDLLLFLKAGIKLFIVYTGSSDAPFQIYLDHWPQQFTSLSQDIWKNEELTAYINTCAKRLNIEFDANFISQLIQYAAGNFRIVREVCYKACLKMGVRKTMDKKITVGQNLDIIALIREVSLDVPEDYSMTPDFAKTVISRNFEEFEQYLNNFSQGLRNGNNKLYAWLLFCIFTATSDELKYGIPLTMIVEKIRRYHDKGMKLDSRLIISALKNIEKLQETKCNNLKFLKYEEDGRGGHLLRIQDNDFFLWLCYRNRTELLLVFNLPVPSLGNE